MDEQQKTTPPDLPASEGSLLGAPADAATPIFLGLCNRSLLHGDGFSQDFYGVANTLALPFFPQGLNGMTLLVAMPMCLLGTSAQVVLADTKRPSNHASLEVKLQSVNGPASPRLFGATRHFPPSPPTPVEPIVGQRILLHPAMTHAMLLVPAPPLLLAEPTTVSVSWQTATSVLPIGGFGCTFVPPTPLSDSEIRAIKSRPGAAKRLAWSMACQKCGDAIRAETSLEKLGVELSDGAVWLDEAPDRWICSCGNVDMPLSYLKLGLHDVFRLSPIVGQNFWAETTPLYEHGAISAILSEYENLIESNPPEEHLQRFLQDNTILWNFLSPIWIKPKPPILTSYNADFAILSPSKILWLIEIEKAHTKLCKADGGLHSELQCGLNQIRDWRVTVQDHRLAFLSSLELSPEEVDDVRFMLIAGCVSRTNPSHLMKLRRNPPAQTEVYCFDEIASFLHATRGSLQRLK
jgi:hypothetical protein